MDISTLTSTPIFEAIYSDKAEATKRYKSILDNFIGYFGEGEVSFFSTSGRSEIIGNHTDHNGGKVIAAGISLDTVAAVRANADNVINLKSEGYEGVFSVRLDDLSVHENEKGTTNALIRGVAERFVQLGYNIGGFDAYASSNVLKGSGLSSSAAFEVLICTVLSGLYNDGALTCAQMGEISQYAENVYFGKPCGLMDQLACACGSIISIDFASKAEIEVVEYDFLRRGYCLIITDVGQDHADLTGEYASIINDMKSVAEYFCKDKLCDVSRDDFIKEIPSIRRVCSDRAVLRAKHFFDECKRVEQGIDALKGGRLGEFFDVVNASGLSSQCLLQNLFVGGSAVQGIPLALDIARDMLGGRGAVRVHGGGFGGTVLAFVPLDIKDEFISTMNGVFGDNAACKLDIRLVSTAFVGKI